MLDRITGMQVFAKVAALGSLSAAARAMGMSQTMATKHVVALESRLGTKLLHRTTRRLSLTEVGRNYLDAIERILSDLDEADAKATIEGTDVRGTLRLNTPVSFGIRVVGPLLQELCARHPGLAIDLGLNDRFVDLIEEGWDLVIRIGTMKNSSLVARKLAPCPALVCASPDYLAKRGRPEMIAELAEHNCLGYTLSRDVGPERWYFGRDGRMSVPVSANLKANNGDVLVAAAVAGQGIIYQPAFLVAREIRAGSLVRIDLDHPTREFDGIFAAYPANRRPPGKVRATIDFLVEAIGRTSAEWVRGQD